MCGKIGWKGGRLGKGDNGILMYYFAMFQGRRQIKGRDVTV